MSKIEIDPEDFQLSAYELDCKYNPEGDGDHPVYTRLDWRQQVAQQATISGYWAWVEHMLDNGYWTWVEHMLDNE